MLTRQEFCDYWERIEPRFSVVNSPLWAGEEHFKVMSNWFLCVKPLNLEGTEKDKYWAWCNENLESSVLCYSSDGEQEEWWGFSSKNDIFLWSLRWI